MSTARVSAFMSLLTSSLSMKRGPYKKRDGEYAVPTPSSVADVAPPGMLNELQRMSAAKARSSRVSSVSEPPSQPCTSAPISQLDQSTPATVPLYIQPVPSARQSEGSFPYSTAVMVPAHAHSQSLASMHSNPSTSHASLNHQSSRDDDQYYQPRYDNLAHGSVRSGQFRMDSCVERQDYQTGHLSHMIEQQRSMRTLQYPSPENSPPRERQYSTPAIYGDNPHRHGMLQASTVHHDASYQSQSDTTHENSTVRAVDAHYPYANQQHHHQRYSNDAHMSDTHSHSHSHSQQQEMQQPHHQQQQQQQYYPGYNTYQPQSSNYASHTYGYTQNHTSHVLAPSQHVSEQTESSYLNRLVPDQVSYGSGSSINAYPTHQPQPQPHPSHPSMSNGMQYPMRTAGRVVHRDMVAHQHAGNVQIQSN